MDQALIDRVIEQIIDDIKDGDLTALDEMLKSVPQSVLISYLPEEISNA